MPKTTQKPRFKDTPVVSPSGRTAVLERLCALIAHREFESPPIRHFTNQQEGLELIVGPQGPLFSCEKAQLEPSSTSTTSTKLLQNAQGLLSVAEAAKLLNKPPITVTRWCQSGRLPAFQKPFGSRMTYLISPKAVTLLLAELQRPKTGKSKQALQPKPHSAYLKGWLTSLEAGTLAGKKYSPVTVSDYMGFVEDFLTQYAAVDPQTLAEAMEAAGGKYARRFNLYKSVVCFAKYLIRQGALGESFLAEVKSLRPKRHLPPKRLAVDEAELGQLLAACNGPLERLMITLLSSTGLRASEACALKREDIDQEKRTLRVRLGKGNKTRSVGLGCAAMTALSEQMTATDSHWVLSDEAGMPLTRMALYNRLRRIGQRAGIKATPHALRRAFVTINANKGRPLQMLQIACGHSDIKTTRSYCLTSEQEVIDAMKNW